MATATIQGSVSVAGLGVSINIERTDEGAIAQDPSLSKAWAGNLSTRTDANTGVFTTTSAHDITVDDFVWIFWTLAGVKKVAYYGDVTAVTGTTVTFDVILGTEGDSGDPLPLAAQTGQIAAGSQTLITFDGDDVGLIAASCTADAHIRFCDGGDAEIHELDLTANEGWFWASDMGWTNDLAGNPITYFWAAQNDITADQTLKVGVLYDST